ncbi:sensor histidine kinase [Hymenobacter actinosclerus]|uniref:histidine kinase n=1 Tax=Hymenobacter actinosclerus TaxID=82805 RepID=A0A1I0BT72_9BACT|nr:HAMP domain-containing sensor histidine kinase [Hymenobacter actinosclerus]SET09586.1 Signal transduction histidine kinase [Hymenobacter actinosclerus]
MKLLTKTNRYYLVLTTALFALAGVGLYYGFYAALRQEVEEQLGNARLHLERRAATGAALPATPFEYQLSVSPRPQPLGYRDTLLLDPVEGEMVPHRQLTFRLPVQGRAAWVTLRKSLVETEDVLGVVLTVLLTVLAVLLLSVLLLNRWLAHHLWAPFRTTLAALRHYGVQEHRVLEFAPVSTDEFAELNEVITRFTRRLVADYEAVREFTANAAHETQTPLAIMQAQLEQLLQLPEMENPQLAGLVTELYQATRRLSRLHQALTLLSKIENRQFAAPPAPLSLAQLLRDKAEQLQPLLEARDLTLHLHLDAEPTGLRLHPGLADSLVHNLLQNAIKHNRSGGFVAVRLSSEALEISNPGPPVSGDPARFFERFQKHDAASASPGLGLSIVQQIGRYYGFRVSYIFEAAESVHTLRVAF